MKKRERNNMKNVIRKRRAYIREIEREEKMDFERTSDPDMLELFFGPEGVKGTHCSVSKF